MKSIDQLRKEIEDAARKQLEAQLKTAADDARAAALRKIETIVAGALGFTNSWGRFEVDHCNGRKTAIANEIGAVAMDAVRAEIAAELDRMLKAPAIRKQIKAAMKRELAEQIDFWMRDSMRDAINERARSIVTSLMEEVKP